MAEHGPIPKRSEERRRQNKPETPLDKVPVSGPVKIPPANPRWHAEAKLIYESLQTSGQAQFCESTDWAKLHLTCEAISRSCKPQVIGISKVTGQVLRAYVPLKGAELAAYNQILASLGYAEGDRRRMGIEIKRNPLQSVPAGVSVMDEYRDALGG